MSLPYNIQRFWGWGCRHIFGGHQLAYYSYVLLSIAGILSRNFRNLKQQYNILPHSSCKPGIWLSLRLGLWLRVSHETSRTRLNLERPTSWLTHVVVLVFSSCGWLATVSVPCYIFLFLDHFTSQQLAPLKWASKGVGGGHRESVSKKEASLFTLVMEFESCHSFRVLFIRRRSLVHPRSREGGSTGAGTLGSLVRTCLPQLSQHGGPVTPACASPDTCSKLSACRILPSASTLISNIVSKVKHIKMIFGIPQYFICTFVSSVSVDRLDCPGKLRVLGGHGRGHLSPGLSVSSSHSEKHLINIVLK